MKTILLSALLCCSASSVFATESESTILVQKVQDKDTFIGKWMTVVPDTPIGDVKAVFVISKDKKGNFTAKADEGYTVQKVTVTDDTLTIVADTEGHFCEIILKIVDEDNLKGTAMEQYEMTATRIKE